MAGRDRCIALRCVPLVGGGQRRCVNGGLCGPNAARRLERADPHPQVDADQPVPGGHGAAVVQERVVHDDDRLPVGIANGDLEGAQRRTSEEALDQCPFVVAGHGSRLPRRGR